MKVKKDTRKKPAKKTRKTTKRKAVSYKENSLKILQDISGSTQGVWNEDAQEYINNLRE